MKIYLDSGFGGEYELPSEWPAQMQFYQIGEYWFFRTGTTYSGLRVYGELKKWSN